MYPVNAPSMNLIGQADFQWDMENSGIGRPQVICLTLRLSNMPRSGIIESNLFRLKSSVLDLDFTIQYALPPIVSSGKRAILDVSSTKGPITGGTFVVITLR